MRMFRVVALSVFVAVPVVAQAQGVPRGINYGAQRGAYTGYSVLGPVGGVVGGVVGGAAGGVVGGVNGIFGIYPLTGITAATTGADSSHGQPGDDLSTGIRLVEGRLGSTPGRPSKSRQPGKAGRAPRERKPDIRLRHDEGDRE